MAEVPTFKKRSVVCNASIAAMLEWIKAEYDSFGAGSLQVQLTRNLQDNRQRGRLQAQRASDEAPVAGAEKKDAVHFPRLNVVVGDIGLYLDRNAMSNKSPYLIGKDRTTNTAYYSTLIPISIQMGLSFQTDDFEHPLVFATAMFAHAPSRSFVFTSDTGFTIAATVNIEPNMTLPQAELGQIGDPYTFETTMRLDTFIGVVTTGRLISTVKSNIYGSLGESDGVITLEELNMKYYDLSDRSSRFYKYDLEGK